MERLVYLIRCSLIGPTKLLFPPHDITKHFLFKAFITGDIVPKNATGPYAFVLKLFNVNESPGRKTFCKTNIY